MTSALVMDIDGVILESQNGTKYQSIKKLLGLLQQEGLSVDTLPNLESDLAELSKEERYYHRFADSYDQVQESEVLQSYVAWEVLKDKAPELLQIREAIEIEGIVTYKFPVNPIKESLEVITDMYWDGNIIPVPFSGSSRHVQEQLLRKVMLERDGKYSDIINELNMYSSVFSSQDYGSKTDKKTYKKIEGELGKLGLPVIGYVSDGLGEVKASRDAGITSYWLTNDERTFPGIENIKDLKMFCPGNRH